MERENLFQHSEELGDILITELRDRLGAHPNVGDIRGKGLLIGLELVSDKHLKTPMDVNFINQVIANCKAKGLIIGKNGVTVAGFNNVLILSPPLSITIEEKDFIVEKLTAVLNEII